MNISNISQSNIKNKVKDFILKNNHPCLMAQSIVENDSLEMVVLQNNSLNEIKKLYDTIEHTTSCNTDSHSFSSIMAIFPKVFVSNEINYENFLWEVLYKLNSMDKYDWDPSVSQKIDNHNYSFSIAGSAFYIVGMYPNSSRKARQIPYVSLVFNLHRQFEKLREMHVYHDIKKRIRKRDKQLQGSINPMLEDFGESSEAKQYSGRIVGENWKCPFFEKQVK